MKRGILLILAFATSINVSRADFAFTKHSIPPEEIRSGGPPKDGIPAILDPRFIPATDAYFLEDADLIIGVVQGGIAKAYPLHILTWHEVVNDRLGEQPIAVTY